MFDELGRYRVIYADPPWAFDTRSKKGAGRSPEQHYNTMTTDEIAAMPVSSIAETDSVCLMWATFPRLPDAMRVMAAWGFAYKTAAFVWAKRNKRAPALFTMDADYFMGCGYYTRANAEICLLGTRGKPKRLARDVRQLVVEPVREHSRKPDCMYGRIERLFDGPYVELFSRTTRNGWDVWGNQTGKFEMPLEIAGMAAECGQPMRWLQG